jgi:hypothetical protein
MMATGFPRSRAMFGAPVTTVAADAGAAPETPSRAAPADKRRERRVSIADHDTAVTNRCHPVPGTPSYGQS